MAPIRYGCIDERGIGFDFIFVPVFFMNFAQGGNDDPEGVEVYLHHGVSCFRSTVLYFQFSK